MDISFESAQPQGTHPLLRCQVFTPLHSTLQQAPAGANQNIVGSGSELKQTISDRGAKKYTCAKIKLLASELMSINVN